MKFQVKKVIRTSCAVALIFSLTIPSTYAVSNSNTPTTNFVSDLWVSNVDKFQNDIETENLLDNNYQNTAVIPLGVEYNYTINDQSNDHVTLNFTIPLNNQEIGFTLQGNLESVPFGDDDIYYLGKLVGEKYVEGQKYSVTAGFQKLESSPNVKIGVVLTPENSDSILMIFGDRVLSYDELENLLKNNEPEIDNVNTSIDNSNQSSLSNDDFIRVYSGYLSTSHPYCDISDAGRMENFVLDSSLKQSMITIQSNCEGISDALSELFSKTAVGVSTVYMESERVSGSGRIAGFASNDTIPEGTLSHPTADALLEYLQFLSNFSDFISLPMGMITALVEAMVGGTVVDDRNVNTKSIEYNLGMFYDDGLDNCTLPVVFEYHSNGTATKYRNTGYITYRCSVRDNLDEGTVFFTDTDTGVSTFTIN